MLDAERLLERGRILYQQAAHLVRLKEPLVCVKTDRIGAFNAAQKFFPLIGHGSKAAVRGVYVQPDSFRRAVIRHRLQRVDGSRAGGPGVGAYRDGAEPGCAVVSHGAGKRVHVQTELPVDRNHAYSFRPDTHNPGCADMRTVALVAHVYGRPFRVAGALTGRDKSVDTGRGTTARQKSTRILRIAKPAPEPVYHYQFHLDWAARNQPGAGIDVIPGDHEIGQHPRPGG